MSDNVSVVGVLILPVSTDIFNWILELFRLRFFSLSHLFILVNLVFGHYKVKTCSFLILTKQS